MLHIRLKSREVEQKLMVLRCLGFNITDLVNKLLLEYEIKLQ